MEKEEWKHILVSLWTHDIVFAFAVAEGQVHGRPHDGALCKWTAEGWALLGEGSKASQVDQDLNQNTEHFTLRVFS